MKSKLLHSLKIWLANPLVRYYFFLFANFRNTYGDSVKIASGAYLRNTILASNIEIGPNTRLVNITIGSNSYVSSDSILANANIGHFCSIGPQVLIAPGQHPSNMISTHPAFYSTRHAWSAKHIKKQLVTENSLVIIGADVWIGARAIILDGIQIGTGAIIGAGAIVTKDIPPYAVAVGNPARVIRKRFSEEQIAKLLISKWWDADIEILLDRIDSFNQNIDLFLSYKWPGNE